MTAFVGGSHSAPQSAEEIRPFVDALQRMDPLIDIRWDPKAVLLEAGSYSVFGKLVPPTYDGRWQVIRWQTPLSRTPTKDRSDFIIICTVGEYTRKNGILQILRDGAYEPVDDRLVELMRSADSHNVEQFRKLRETLWAASDQVDIDADKINDAEAREGLDRAHFKANYAGGTGNWMSTGADFKAMTADPKGHQQYKQHPSSHIPTP